ncbi:MAG: hypothetical protein OXC40_00925, partial [Proteobacteria bacterium]|nr:hypothetical protein [Pseudomonadota bacterium]
MSLIVITVMVFAACQDRGFRSDTYKKYWTVPSTADLEKTIGINDLKQYGEDDENGGGDSQSTGDGGNNGDDGGDSQSTGDGGNNGDDGGDSQSTGDGG